MKNLLTIIIFLISINLFSQNIDCSRASPPTPPNNIFPGVAWQCHGPTPV